MRFLSLSLPVALAALAAATAPRAVTDVTVATPIAPASFNLLIPPSIGAAPAYTTSGTKGFYVNCGAVYCDYKAWTRQCTTGDTSTCSETWVQRVNTFVDTGVPQSFDAYVTVDNAEDCEDYGPTFQIKFTSSGFGQPQSTIYHTSNVCDPLAD